MSIYSKWENLIGNQSDDSFPDFWKKYSEAETKLYNSILDKPEEQVTGTITTLAKSMKLDPVLVTGFLDGISSSLNKEITVKEFDENTEFVLDINFEKLYFNMLEAGAEYLFTLPQWPNILSEETIIEITKAQKASKTVVKEDKIGRNEPCPCGSGKKYKKCCGK